MAREALRAAISTPTPAAKIHPARFSGFHIGLLFATRTGDATAPSSRCAPARSAGGSAAGAALERLLRRAAAAAREDAGVRGLVAELRPGELLQRGHGTAIAQRAESVRGFRAGLALLRL